MRHHGMAFDYVPSDAAPPPAFASEAYALYVVSDYPARQFGAAAMVHVAGVVRQGAGLVMLGGWESFFGRLGEYPQSPLAEVLPVVMAQTDDRRNCAQPCLIDKTAEHPILEGLPWDEPPGIGGFNVLRAKPGTETPLRAVEFAVRRGGGEFCFVRGQQWPLLVVGQHGRGRTAALAVDVAPALGRRTGRLGRPAGDRGRGRRVDRGRQLVCPVFRQSAGVDGKAVGFIVQPANLFAVWGINATARRPGSPAKRGGQVHRKRTFFMLHGNAIIGQSGGPTSVINASLCGIIQQCLAQKAVGRRWECASASKGSCAAT